MFCFPKAFILATPIPEQFTLHVFSEFRSLYNNRQQQKWYGDIERKLLANYLVSYKMTGIYECDQ